MWALWLSLAGSTGLWLLVLVRMRFLEQMFPALDAATPLEEPYGEWPFVSVIVPARNEERDVVACLDSLARQDYPAYELIFVDDESTDRTAVLAERALKACAGARIIRGRPRPSAAWVGKSWALTQGSAEARGTWLLFIDADVVHHPLAIRQAVAMAIQVHADALSILPAIECRSFWEKTVMPLFALLSALVAPMDRANHPEKRSSRLSGAFILIRRAVYESTGGHRAVADQVLEDMALAQVLKRAQRQVWLTYTHDLAHTRMYDRFRDLWAGLIRLSFPIMNYSLGLLLCAYLAAFVGALTPWLALAVGAWGIIQGMPGGWPMFGLGLTLCAGSPLVLKKIFVVLKVPRAYAWCFPLAAAIYCLAGTVSAWRHFTGRGLDWKQRLYRPGAASAPPAT